MQTINPLPFRHFWLPPRQAHLVFLKCAARLVGTRWINRRSPLLDVSDDSVFVDDESSATANESLLIEDAIGFDHLSFDVAEQGKGHSDVFFKALVGSKAVNTDADDLCIGLLEIGDISLIRL